MTNKKEKILEYEIGKFAELIGSEVGTYIGIAGNLFLDNIVYINSGKAVSKGAREGTLIANKLLPTESKKYGFIANKNIKEVNSTIQNLFKSNGSLKEATTKEGKDIIKGVIKSGFFNMNPCYLEIILTVISTEKTGVYIGASAKEGLIKQNTAIKAIKKISVLLK